MVLTGAMMLDWLGETDGGRRVREAVDAVLADGTIAIEAEGTVLHGTRAAGQAVIERLKR
jgi:isocitrate/isopropylmalate dehydrogenase